MSYRIIRINSFFVMKSVVSVLIGLLSLVLLPAPVVLAHGGHEMSLADAMAQLRESLGLEANAHIVCEMLTEAQFEFLGEVVMAELYGDEEKHEIVDQLAGGEGSEQLRRAHVEVGAKYLGCHGDGGWETFWEGLLPGATMGGFLSSGSFESLRPIWWWVGRWVSLVVFWGVFIIGGVVVVRALLRKRCGNCEHEIGMEDVQTRLAKGEVSRKRDEDN